MGSRFRRWFAAWGSAALLGVAGLPATAQVTLTELYLPSNGVPLVQGWLPLIQGTAGIESLQPDSFQLNTLADENTQHGYARISPVPLDTAIGFQLTFNLRVDGSSSSSVNRGGYSLVLVGDDPSKSLELVFLTNEVFVYDYVGSDPDRFVRGASASITPFVPNSYVLTVVNDSFNLNVSGQNLLSGPLVDYSAQGLPYTTPNFVFFGDDTSRAASNAYLGPLVLATTVPEPASALLWAVGGLGMAGWLQRRRRIG
jgi:hypothetical protein